MKIVLQQPKKQPPHEQLTRMELALAERPEDINGRLELAMAYGAAGLHDAAMAELARLAQRFPQHPLVMAEQLHMLIETRTMSVLKAVLRRAEAVRTPPKELKVATAAALTHLRQFVKAAPLFAALLQDGFLPERALKPFAEFVRVCPDTGRLALALERMVQDNDLGVFPMLLRYAFIRTQVEDTPTRARELLKGMKLEDIDSHDIALDIAILAFRLGDWPSAIIAAQRARALSPAGQVAGRVLVSAYAFAGRLQEASTWIHSLRVPELALRLIPSQMAAIRKFVAEYAETNVAYAIVVGGPEPGHPCRIVMRTWQQLSEDLPETLADSRGAVTVSTVGQNGGHLGPWEILAEVDLTVPHLVVQQLESSLVLHVFVAVSDGIENWSWQQIPVSVSDGDSLALHGFSFLTTRKTQDSDHAWTTNDLWKRVAVEIDAIHPDTDPSHE